MVLPIAFSASGIVLLYAAWSRRLSARRQAVAAGWMSLLLSVIFWVRAEGGELGPLYALLVLPPLAWLAVLSNTRARNGRDLREAPAQSRLPPLPALFRHGTLFLTAVPLAAVASALSVVAVGSWLPGDVVNRMAFGSLAMPVVWGVLAYWACADSLLLRPAAILVAIAAVAAAFLFLPSP